jgi:hypothetical protein
VVLRFLIFCFFAEQIGLKVEDYKGLSVCKVLVLEVSLCGSSGKLRDGATIQRDLV